MSNTYKFHMHTHSSHESMSSMRGIAYRCSRLGIDGAFVTDHDTRMGILKNAVNMYDVSGHKSLHTKSPADDAFIFGWTPGEGSDVLIGNAAGKDAMLLKAAPGSVCEAGFSSRGKRHHVSLLAQLTMSLDLCALGFDPSKHGVMVDITLSQRPPDFEIEHLCYLAGTCPDMPDVYMPIRFELRENWQELSFALSEDVLRFSEFGEDNCFSHLTLRLFCSEGAEPFTVAHSRFELSRLITAETVRIRQQELACRIGGTYGVKLYVGTEITGLGQHKVSFSEAVPLIDYLREGYPSDAAFAIEHVRRYGGIHSYNHMFDTYHKKSIYDKVLNREEYIRERTADMLASRCDEAALIEVGYPVGRGGFLMHEYMRVWDELALNGLFLTGYGTNDSHSCTGDWESGNNFCAYIAAESVERGSLIKALVSGNSYSADPALWKDGALSAYCEGRPMGSAVRTQYGKMYRVTFRLNLPGTLRTLGTLRTVISSHGRVLSESEYVTGCGECEYHADVIPVKPVEAVRAMLYGSDGRCLLFTNPIYLVSEPEVAIPPERI